jgi:type IV pilus assembly protein PilB
MSLSSEGHTVVKERQVSADNPFEGSTIATKKPPSVRDPEPGGPETTAHAPTLATAFGVSETAELVLDLLGRTTLVPPDVLALVRGRAARGMPVTQALVEEGVATPEGAARMLAARHHLPIVDLPGVGVAAEAAHLIPIQTLERAVAVPYALEDDVLKLVVADPGNLHAIDELRLATKHTLELGVASRDDIVAELRRLARAAEAVGTAFVEIDEASEPGDDLDVDDGISDGPLVRLVNALIFQAAEENASDVHFEAQEDALAVRFRIDGVLREVQRIPKRMAAGVTTRLKVLAKLDIAERRKPQDGRLTLSTSAVGRMLDIRVATLPTVEGEKVVMRLLDKSRKPPTLTELGLSDAMRAELEQIVRMPTGALLVTGPTGSGKSTTLYGCLAQINRPEINIITVEDPVEYRLAGVNQVQINVRAGLTFASSLRSILRSDPDVVMVGEIRDTETAKISIEAALTGHFVLSTLHTNDAPSTITRLGEMGVEPFLTGAAVSAVLAQRLARKLCAHCCEAYQPTQAELVEARVSSEFMRATDGAVFYRKNGCPRCNHTGYRGRIGVFQLLRMSEEIAALAVQHSSRDEIARAATQNGMRTLWNDGMEKVVSGLTSLEELARVLS